MFRLVASLSLICSAVAVAQEGTTEQATAPDPLHPQFKMTTTLGDIILELDAEKAPVTVLNFYHYADNGYYSGTVFHRVINSFMIQGGGFILEAKPNDGSTDQSEQAWGLKQKKEGLFPPIKNEWRNGLKNNSGTISMARLGGNPDSATSQFFINVVDNDRLDKPQPDGAAYAVFGKVVDGIDVVEAIRYTEVENHPDYPSRSPVTPATPVVIESVTLLTEFDRTRVEAIVKEREEAEAKAALEAQGAIKKEMDTAARKIEGEQGKRFTTTASGLRYLTLVEGTGETPGPTDQVQVHYTGWLLDGTEFDSSYKPRPNLPEGQPFTFSLKGGVIKGWMEGVATMKVGEKRKLLIPPDLAYGKAGFRNTIPPNAILMFDVELLGIK